MTRIGSELTKEETGNYKKEEFELSQPNVDLKLGNRILNSDLSMRNVKSLTLISISLARPK